MVETLRSEDEATEGWNRLVEKLDRLQRHDSIIERLESVAGQTNDGRWQETLDALPDILIVANAEGTIRYANRALSIACGWQDTQQAIGEPLNGVLVNIIGGDDASELDELKTLCGGESVEIGRSDNSADGVWRVARLY